MHACSAGAQVSDQTLFLCVSAAFVASTAAIALVVDDLGKVLQSSSRDSALVASRPARMPLSPLEASLACPSALPGFV
eukprot:2842462-Pleurochrysis_carterae.AAC.2